MSDIMIHRIGGAAPLSAPGVAGQPAKPGDSSFDDVLSGLVREVNDLQIQAGQMREDLIAGEAPDLHQIMIAGEKAGVALELLVEVRNKLIEAYQELMRMPV